MLKGIAYIGYGFVGKACHEQFMHNVSAVIVDPKYSANTVKDVLETEVAFVSINAPTLPDRTVDTSVIYKIFAELEEIQYKGIVVLKSTVPPLQVQDLADKFTKLRYVYSPEFLRENSWKLDSLRPSQIIIAGEKDTCEDLADIYTMHSHVWQAVKYVTGVDYKDAALVKYTINCYLASKVTFMNQVQELWKDVHQEDELSDLSWKVLTTMLSNDTRFGNSHLNVPGPDGQYGYGGSCFPKDVKAMIGFDELERMSVLRETEIANTKHRLK